MLALTKTITLPQTSYEDMLATARRIQFERDALRRLYADAQEELYRRQAQINTLQAELDALSDDRG